MMFELRPYQRQALNDLYRWCSEHDGNPCIEAPTGSGKSLLLAKFCQENLGMRSDLSILVVTHVKELVQQNYNKLVELWPDAPCGIYSAGLGRKDITPITFCGIQSVYSKASYFGKVDVLLIDEAHTIPVKGTGMYLTFIDELKERNPDLVVIGFTATPYRLGHGMITDKPGIFSAPLIRTTTIPYLQGMGYLAMLRSKFTTQRLNTDGVRIQNGDYVESELQKAVDKEGTSRSVVKETIMRAAGRKHILFFCCGVEHAMHIRDLLRDEGETAEMVTGKTPKTERDRIIEEFKEGRFRFLTNVSVLTTGFDYPDIDCIVMMRPTLSPVLYIQEVGRGLRLKSGGGDCLILDFAGNIATHGPISSVRPPRPKGRRKGVAPCKVCPECDEIVAAQTRVCPSCGHEFPINRNEREWTLHQDDINGESVSRGLDVGMWRWFLTKSRKGEDMIKVTYMGRSFVDPQISEYFLIWHEGFVGEKAMSGMIRICVQAGINPNDYGEIDRLLSGLNDNGRPPRHIAYEMNGKYPKVTGRYWGE